MSSVASAWARFDTLAHFSRAQLVSLASCASQLRFEAGAAVLRENERSSDVYLVERGTVHLERDSPYGSFRFANLGEGEMFGETAFLDQEPRSLAVSAAGIVDLWVLPAAELRAMVAEDPAFAVALHWAIWKSLSAKLRAANRRLDSFFPAGAEPASKPPAAGTPSTSLRLGPSAKRSVFEEQTLSALEVNFLASLSKELRYETGEIIFREGDEGDAMFVVVSGRVRISRTLPGIGEEALMILARGAFFGEMALIDRLPRSADARAHEGDAVVLRMPREVVEQLLDIRKVSSVRLLGLLCGLVARRLREVDDKLAGWHLLSGGEVSALPEDSRP
jgi:CRP/FNR family transcriptional regulator, cyclic AMP receptor protein